MQADIRNVLVTSDDSSYNRLVSDATAFNRRLGIDRKCRLPFLDSATGIAQRPAPWLFRAVHDRLPGCHPSQMYSYPGYRWKKSKRHGPPDLGPQDYPLLKPETLYGASSFLAGINADTDSNDNTPGQRVSSVAGTDSSHSRPASLVGAEPSTGPPTLQPATPGPPASSGPYSLDDDDISESGLEGGPSLDPGSDESDYFDEINRRKRKSRGGRGGYRGVRGAGRGRARGGGGPGSRGPRERRWPEPSGSGELARSPGGGDGGGGAEAEVRTTVYFHCEVCATRYRSTAGLRYHYNSQHPGYAPSRPISASATTVRETGPPPPTGTQANKLAAANAAASATSLTRLLIDDSSQSSSRLHPIHDMTSSEYCSGNTPLSNAPPSSGVGYTCDFCLGDEQHNPKTGQPEEMLRCADCSRCAHFTCLQFTPNMIHSAGKYAWQCIECKTCWLCGTSENDEEMLFCDDCDRGYHMFCLVPALTEPPAGHWSCQLCVEEFYGGTTINL